MKTKRTSHFLAVARCAFTVCAVYCLTSASASAQFSFGRAANQPWSGGIKVTNRMGPPAGTPLTASVNLMPIMNANWQTARGQLASKAVAFLNEHDIGHGWRTSKCQLDLANSGPLFVGHDGSGFTIRFSVRGNSLKTWLRTPTGVSEDVDPGFRVTFDLDVTIDLVVRGNRLVAGPAKLTANAQRPVGTNVPGSAAVAAADLLKNFIGGPDLIGQLLTMLNSRQFSFDTGINKELAKFNLILSRAAGGGAIQPGYEAATKSATLTLVKAGPLPVVR